MRRPSKSSPRQGTGRYRAYPECKDSGVEWLGEIPKGWRVVRNLGIFADRREKGYPNLPIYSVTQNDGVILQDDVSIKIVRPSENRDGYKRIHPGDLVYNKMRMWQGAVGTSSATAIVSPAYVICKPRDEVETRYFEYLYRTPVFITESGRYSYGICDDMNSLRFDDFKGIYSLVPPLSEQRAIAAFLDRETTKIDALIEKKERLIGVLQEKRTALITHAVTKGLHPDVPMKNSGVEWLGEIPAHWEVAKVKRVSSVFVPERSKPELNSDQIGFPWITTEDLHDREVSASSSNRWVSKSAAHAAGSRSLSAGSVLVSCVGNFGLATVNAVECIINQQVQAYVPKKIYAHFLRYVVNASAVFFEREATVATIKYVNSERFAEMPLGIPPANEQRTVVQFVDTETRIIDTLANKISQGIDRLKEYRTALVSTAVTGRIDVREEVA